MSSTSLHNKQMLEAKLDVAMEEAWSKVNTALDHVSKSPRDSHMSIWQAAEAAEYASLLFNLTHGLEDIDPQLKGRRREDLLVLLKDSLESLRKARELRQKSAIEAYNSLRVAADALKTAYLDGVREAAKNPR